MNIFKEIYDKNRFDSIYEHEVFKENIDLALSDNLLKELNPLKREGKILSKTERWFLDEKTGEIYRYKPPNYPACGVWEPVER